MIAETLNHHIRPRRPSASWPCGVLSPSERVIAPRSARVLLASLPAPRLTRNAVKLRAQFDPAHAERSNTGQERVAGRGNGSSPGRPNGSSPGTAKRIRLGTAKWILAGTAKRILNKPPV